MKKFINFLILWLSNITYTNFFFKKFEQSDISIALDGLNNFSEDLKDLGFPVGFELNYLYFSIFVGTLLTTFSYLIIYKNFKISSPNDLFKIFFKLFSFNLATVIFTLYLFRFFNFPRVFILLNFMFYPFIFLFLMFLLNKNNIDEPNKKNQIITNLFNLFLIVFLTIVLYGQLSTTLLSAEILDSDDVSIEQELDITIPLGDNSPCFKWAGSSNYSGCKEALNLKKIKSYSENQVNNFVVFESDLYTVLKRGIILKNGLLFLDLTNKVGWEDASESGLYDISFHPLEKYFLVSYSSIQNDLIIESYELSNSGEVVFGDTLQIIPNSTYSHYCGSLTWSEYFNTFLYCVGDMGDERLSISTNVKNGKILLLDENISINTPLITDLASQSKLNNFIAYGLRNPWNFIEYNDLLIIPDVGNKSREELNLVDLNSFNSDKGPYLFGWPIYEGNLLSEDKFYGLKLWDSPELDIYDYVVENNLSPIVYYERPAPENSRSAILGTLIYENKNSFFDQHIIFADFLSKEIFSYNYQTDSLYIINLPYFPGYLTAIANHPNDSSKIIFSTSNEGNSEVYEVELP